MNGIKGSVKSRNSSVACRCFARAPLRILRIVNICEVEFSSEAILVFPKKVVNFGFDAVL